MVQHQVYYRSTQHLENNDERETTPNAGHSKITNIAFAFSADIIDEKGRKNLHSFVFEIIRRLKESYG